MEILLTALMVVSGTSLPSTLTDGRFFYEPAVAGRRLRIWLDTDGSGFVTEGCAKALGLSGRAVVLPPPVVPPLAGEGRLPVFAPDPADRIFHGIDAQFGAGWFAGRVVLLDYPRARLEMLPEAGAQAGALGRAPMMLAGGFATVPVTVGDERVEMTFDTAATVALTPEATAAMHDRWGAVRATSFVTAAVMHRWHTVHPQWRYIRGAGGPGIDAIEAPRVAIGTYRTARVWFTTRPDDDVFEGERVSGKIGPTAFFEAAVTLDYPSNVIYFDP